MSCHSSTKVGLWSSTTTFPSTITVSTLLPSALYTRLLTGLKIVRHSARLVSKSTRSAFFPASMEPISLSRPRARAPWMVAHLQRGFGRDHISGPPRVLEQHGYQVH